MIPGIQLRGEILIAQGSQKRKKYNNNDNDNDNDNIGKEILGIRRKIIEVFMNFCFINRNNSLSYLVKNMNLC
jgi:hypothetical protein